MSDTTQTIRNVAGSSNQTLQIDMRPILVGQAVRS